MSTHALSPSTVQTRLLASTDFLDTETIPAFLAGFNRLNPQTYPFLLGSTANREDNTQYDILPAFPLYTLSLDANRRLHCDNGGLPQGLPDNAGFFDVLEAFFQQEKQSLENSALPFTGGWFVYLAYEMAGEIEPCLDLPPVKNTQPMALAARCPAAIIHDRKNRQLLTLAEAGHEQLLDIMEKDFRRLKSAFQPSSGQPAAGASEAVRLSHLQEAAEAPYMQQVARIRQYIVDGDIFQANLSRLWQGKLADDIDDATLFSALAQHNPSSFAALASLPGMSIVSSSPERLVSLRDNTVQTRPIAGTRRRDSRQADDEALASELLAHPKEQAEHIMLIDLERNDLGRVCKPGSIEVNELMVLETWEHVHHIVSNVRGQLQANKSPVDVLRAVFPGGTITGCPKVRCMEILAQLEQQARGAYTGSLGYINRDGSMDFNILIRTLVREGRAISFRAGGGIVSDSIAESELAETRAKARGLLKIFNREIPEEMSA